MVQNAQQRRRFQRVAVLKGGPSAERAVSLRSGAAVADGLRQAGYTVVEVDVTREALSLPAGIEAVFIALHGRFGEDGAVQALLDDRGIPYTGSGAESSRVSMDKTLMRARLAAAGIPIPEGKTLFRPARMSPLPLPVVVKPVAQGSSLGCHIVDDAAAWPEAVEDALSYDGAAVVEAFIPGRELTLGIVDGLELPAVEICAPGGWYDYRAKYTVGCTRYLAPAPIEPQPRVAVQRLARGTFDALGARGFGRVDFRMEADGSLFVLELNTVPGFTETSLLPKAAAAAGTSFSALCDHILNLATFGA